MWAVACSYVWTNTLRDAQRQLNEYYVEILSVYTLWGKKLRHFIFAVTLLKRFTVK